MVKIIAKARLNTARRSNVPRATDPTRIETGMEVYCVYREGPDKLIGPIKVVSVDVKQYIRVIKGDLKPFSIDKAKKYVRETPENPPLSVAISQPNPPNNPPAQTRELPTEFESTVDAIVESDTYFTKLNDNIQSIKRDGETAEI